MARRAHRMQVPPPSDVSAGRAALRSLPLALALAALGSGASAARSTARHGQHGEDAAVAIEVLAVLEDERAPVRSPVLVARGDALALFHQAGDGWVERSWTGSGLGDAAAADGVPGGAATELELSAFDASPPAPGRNGLPGELRVSSSVWRNGRLLSDGRPIGWCPDRAAGYLVFDRFEGGDYDVVVRDPDGAEVVVAGSARFEANASACVDLTGRLFVAWDEGGEHWGRGGALHDERRVRVACRDEGRWRELELPPLLDGARGKASEGFSTSEMPRLVADEAGPVWFLYRAMDRWDRLEEDGRRGDPDRGANRRVMWKWRVLVLGPDGWSEPVTLPDSDGAGYDGLAALALAGGGVAVSYESDGRAREFPRTAAWEAPLAAGARLVAARLGAPGGVPRPTYAGSIAPGRGAELADSSRDPSDAPGAERTRFRVAAADDASDGFLRLWGDLHRHSDLSRCKMDQDGNQIAQYRYALDVEALDFLAITEHYQHLTPGHWSYARELAERFDEPGRFVTLFGFEQAQEDGHRNLFCIDAAEAVDAPFRDLKAQRRWEEFSTGNWLAVPHQLADPQVPLDWSLHRPAIERVVEVYQSRRGSYVAADDYLRAFGRAGAHPHALDYTNEGRRFGFVAASDHLTTGGAFTAAYATERTRAGVFEALEARRTYAATARIGLFVELGGAMMGGEARVAPDAKLALHVDAGAELARVEVLYNGQVAKTWSGDAAAGVNLLTVRAPAENLDVEVLVALDGASWTSGPRALRRLAHGTPSVTERGVRLSPELEVFGECGLIGAIATEAGRSGSVRLQRARREATVALADLELGVPVLERVGPVRVELRLDPPALGRDALTAEWRPEVWTAGDWVSVRVVRTDGEMAWSSPIWIEEVGQ